MWVECIFIFECVIFIIFHLLNLFASSFLSTLRKDSIAEPFYGLIGEVFELKGGTLLHVI